MLIVYPTIIPEFHKSSSLTTAVEKVLGTFSARSARQIVEIPLAISEILKNIPRELERLISSMLAKKPDDRPLDMTAEINSLAPYGNVITSQRTVTIK